MRRTGLLKPRKLLSLMLPLALGLASSAQAEWMLDNASSSFYYVTSKAAAISEVNSFSELRGGITDDGQATLVIHLASVDTAVDIRNERMRDIVFQVEQFASATVTVDVSALDLDGMEAGASERMTLPAELALHGLSEAVTANVRVTRLASGGVQVENTSPILVNAATFGLAEGVEELRNVAGLPSINPNVTVDFSLVYEPY